MLDSRGEKRQALFQYLIELKYLKKSEATEKAIESVEQEAHRQMQGYLQLEEFAKDRRIKGIIYVVVKDKIRCFEKISLWEPL